MTTIIMALFFATCPVDNGCVALCKFKYEKCLKNVPEWSCNMTYKKCLKRCK